MSKRNAVSYVKPEEPNFLKRLKQEIGYKEGPTVDTKREDLGPVGEEDFEDTSEEQPTVVVLQPGDLTAEEAAKETEKFERELAEKPADLNARIVFKAPVKNQNAGKEKLEEKQSTSKPASEKSKSKKSKEVKNKTLLSFDTEENDDY